MDDDDLTEDVARRIGAAAMAHAAAMRKFAGAVEAVSNAVREMILRHPMGAIRAKESAEAAVARGMRRHPGAEE